jgi:hypothetical protein
MPDDSPYNAPPVIQALLAASRALEGSRARPPRELPVNAGKPWDAKQDAWLDTAFAAGSDIGQLAKELGRTPFAVESRLVKLGKLLPRPGMRVSAPPSAA